MKKRVQNLIWFAASILLAATTIVIIIVLWKAPESNENLPGSVTGKRSHPENNLVSGSPASRSIDPRVSIHEDHYTLRVVDVISNSPLRATLIGPGRKHLGKTETNGEMKLSFSDVLTMPLKDLELQVQTELGSDNFVVGGYVYEEKPREMVVRVPAYSRTEISISPDSARELEAAITLLGLPEISLADGKCSATQMELLSRTRRLHPEMYIKTLTAIIRDLKNPNVSREAPSTREGLVIDLPYNGDVAVTVYIKSFIPTVKFVNVKKGFRTRIECEVSAKPVITGILYGDGGLPVPDHPVTVGTKSIFSDVEPMPRSSAEPGSPGFITLSMRGSTEHTVIAQLTVMTDKVGRFRAEMPFTDDVAGWAYCVTDQHSPATAYVERRSGSRTAQVKELDLLLEKVSRKKRIRFVFDTGELCSCRRLTFTKSNPAHPFQQTLPDFGTDSDGWCDVSLLDEGSQYQVTFLDGAGTVSGFITCHDGNVVNVRKK